MNKITKRSFYSFLSLYLISSFIFLTLASYWFYTAQLSMEMNSNFHKMNNISKQVTSDVIYVHMMKKDFKLQSFIEDKVALFDKDKRLLYGSLLQEVDFSKEYYKDRMTFSLISKTVSGYLGLEYIIIQNNKCVSNVQKLKNTVFYTALAVGILIIIIAFLLSYMFLKPLKDKMQEIEEFIKDTTHELNTPISALMMSTSRVKEKKIYDEKIITNISISTKQLYEIYSSLTFLSFDTASEKPRKIAFEEIVQNSIEYFNELMRKKNILLSFDKNSCILNIAPSRATMLINNLLSNAIKYSPPNTNISLKISQNELSVQDEGIGIPKDKLDSIFERFKRASSYAGGFGIGLSIVESITKEYGYKIKIESEENKGTIVKITF